MKIRLAKKLFYKEKCRIPFKWRLCLCLYKSTYCRQGSKEIRKTHKIKTYILLI